MFTRMMPEDVRRNQASANGFSVVQGDHHGNLFDPGTLAANGSFYWTHKPLLSGICNSGKYMPLQFLGSGGMVLEFELGNATEGIDARAANSSSWHISDVRVQASVINLNSKLQEADSAHVLSGNV